MRHKEAHWFVECVAEFVSAMLRALRTRADCRGFQTAVFLYCFAGESVTAVQSDPAYLVLIDRNWFYCTLCPGQHCGAGASL